MHAQVIEVLVPMFKKLAEDDQDSVRLLVVEAVAGLSVKLSPEEVDSHLTTTIKTLCEDQSWRVRYMCAENFVHLCKVCFHVTAQF